MIFKSSNISNGKTILETNIQNDHNASLADAGSAVEIEDEITNTLKSLFAEENATTLQTIASF